MLEIRWSLLFVKSMSSLEISNSCFSPETKLPLSPQLAEDRASEPARCVLSLFPSLVLQDPTHDSLYLVCCVLYWCNINGVASLMVGRDAHRLPSPITLVVSGLMSAGRVHYIYFTFAYWDLTMLVFWWWENKFREVKKETRLWGLGRWRCL